MESSDDVYSKWAVVEVSPRIYVGEIVSGPDEEGFYDMAGMFELVVVRANVPQKDGSIGMAQQNMHTPLPLCVDGEKMRVKPNCIRRFDALSEASRREHIIFVESARQSFTEERARKSNIQPANPRDLANLTSRHRG